MIESRVHCPACERNIHSRYSTYWECVSCGTKYPCTQGIPRLYIEERLGKTDKDLRDRLYNALLGRVYNFMMPFLTIPARPIRMSRLHWFVYFLMVFVLVFLVYQCGEWIVLRQFQDTTLLDVASSFLLVVNILFFVKHPYIAYLLLLAVPTKISLSLTPFKPITSFNQVHAEFQKSYLEATDRLRLLDVATGSCNSLFKHGWMKLNADFVGVDLSEKMLIQGMRFMSKHEVPVDFYLCDAGRLPFESETFDIVTSYGAVNGYSDTKTALKEMVRVTKKGGTIFFLDEQLYEGATWFERAYFRRVLSPHDTIDRCPISMLPDQLEDIQVHQVYQFYYICTARKRLG